MEMHRHRKEVFIDQMKWRLEESAGIEIDTLRLSGGDLPHRSSGAARGCDRFGAAFCEPDRPHLLGDHFRFSAMTNRPGPMWGSDAVLSGA